MVAGDGEGDLRVWIDPIELRDGGLKRGIVAAVVHRHRMVSKRSAGHHQASAKHRDGRNNPGFHRDTSRH